MKKLFLTALLIGASMITAYPAQSNSGTIEQMDIETFVKTLDSVDGFILIGKGECRDLALTLERETGNELDYNAAQDLHWSVINPMIAQVNKDGLLDGINYGETIITCSDGKDLKQSYVVFVCPSITIVSPEGAIYSYHKVYNQKTRIQFTQSNDYKINSVLRDGVDITSEIDKVTGWYESDQLITDDTTFWVTMEARNGKARNSDDAIGGDDVKVTVDGWNVTIDGPSNVLAEPIKVYDLWGNTLFDRRWPADGTLEFNHGNVGVFLIEIPNYSTYKIIIHES